jgi:aromatic ring-opening dioxygenase catalytic subunit (LigB family)
MADDYVALDQYLRRLPESLPSKPRAVLCVSAHWEAPEPTVMTAASPPMLYDYYGFPSEAYAFQWPSPGAPQVAGLVRDRLADAGFDVAQDPERGFDHGAFVPLMLSYPDADMPTFQLSLIQGLDPARHIEMGKALAPLRDEGVLIVGSGMSYHNMRMFQAAFRDAGARERMDADSRAFDDWLAATMAAEPSVRESRLAKWADAPAARAAHPREEHLLPLMVTLGAALEGESTLPYRDRILGAHVSAVHLA